MQLFDRYLIRSFGQSFFPIFPALFLIISITFFIQIAVQTSHLKVSFFEIMQLYMCYVPELLMYTLPISFFAAAIIALSKLSFDLELIVFFALQGNIWRIIRPLAIIATIMMAILLIVGLWLKPKAKLVSKEIIYEKRDTSQLNLRPSEYGQKFGNWMLHVEKKVGDRAYEQLVLFSKQDTKDFFIRAEKGAILQTKGYFNLLLEDGETYTIDEDGIKQVRFEEMKVNEKSSLKQLSYYDIIGYWIERLKENPRDFSSAILTGIFPFISLVLIVSIGVLNPRFQKNRSSVYIIVLASFYFGLTYGFGEKHPFLSLLIVPLIWAAISLYFYKRRIAGQY